MRTREYDLTNAPQPLVTRVVVIDHHQMVIDAVNAWLRGKAPDLVVVAEFTTLSKFTTASNFNTVPQKREAPVAMDKEASVAVLGTLDPGTELVPTVQQLVGAGLAVVVLANALVGWEVGQARTAGALGFVPMTANPLHVEYAIRAAAAGRPYVHPAASAIMVDTAPLRVQLSLREQRLVELYLGPEAIPIRAVAEAMGISEQTVKAHLHRIRQRYAGAGIRLGNVIRLHQQLKTDGWIT